MNERNFGKQVKRGVVIAGAAALSLSILAGNAQAENSSQVSSYQAQNDLEAEEFEDDSSLEAPLEPNALVIEDDGSAAAANPNLFRLSLMVPESCRAQLRVTAYQWWVNPKHEGRIAAPNGALKYNPPVQGSPQKPGDFSRPWVNKIFRVTAFNQRKTIVGTSARNEDGRAIFNSEDPAKPPATVLEFRSLQNEGNGLNVEVAREGGLARRIGIACNRLQEIAYRMWVPAQ